MEICTKCGAPMKAQDINKFVCEYCGNTVQIEQKTPILQRIVKAPDNNDSERKDWLTTLLLCIFFGYLGIHRFYTKDIVIGVVQFLTFGGCGIWALIDLIMILTNSYKDGNGQHLLKK